jgi:hypothetical protein
VTAAVRRLPGRSAALALALPLAWPLYLAGSIALYARHSASGSADAAIVLSAAVAGDGLSPVCQLAEPRRFLAREVYFYARYLVVHHVQRDIAA